MRIEQMTVKYQEEIAERVYELILEGEMVAEMMAGQFINIKPTRKDLMLRRPISLAKIDQDKQECTIIYRVDGDGTQTFADAKVGDVLDVIGPLGKGFPVDETLAGETAMLIGGGIGVPPLYEVARQLKAAGANVVTVLGFNSKEAVFYEAEFAALGDVHIATADGSHGTHEFVTTIMDTLPEADTYYSCGPTPMLRALNERLIDKRAFISLEERMACGIGACYACVCHPTTGEETASKKICVDGPVFRTGEVQV